MDEIDRKLALLGRVDVDHDLAALEAAVWAKVDARARRGLTPMPARMAAMVCVASATLILLGGGVTAMAAQTHAPAVSLLAIHQAFAPATALDR